MFHDVNFLRQAAHCEQHPSAAVSALPPCDAFTEELCFLSEADERYVTSECGDCRFGF